MMQIIDLITNHKKLDKYLFEVKDVDGDVNCYFRTLSLYFTQFNHIMNFFVNKYIMVQKKILMI